MSISTEYDFPVIVGSGSVLTSGHAGDLKAGQFAFADAFTLNVINGSNDPNRKIVFANGSWHTKDKLDRYRGGLLRSDKSTEFLVKDIISFEKSIPLKAKSEEWILGWDGVGADSLEFECDKEYRFRVEVKGEPVYGTFLRPLIREIGFKTDCCDTDSCSETCSDEVPGLKYAKQIAHLINTDPELKYFVQAEAIWSSATTHSATHYVWHITVPDDGTQMALAALQVSSTYGVTRISRQGIYSTYEVLVPVAVVSLTDFTPAAPFALAECKECPAGFTLTGGSQEVFVQRVVTPSTDLDDPTAQQTYADTIGTAYKADSIATIPTTDVNTTTEVITETAHKFVTGQKIVYANGGGTTLAGLTSGNTYYAIKVTANTFKVASTYANAVAGTAINLTGTGNNAQTFTPVITASFVSLKNGIATVKLTVAPGITVTALLSDNVLTGALVGDTCVATSPTPIAWVKGDGKYKVTRTLNITLEKECDGANRLAELQAFYANDTSIASTIVVLTAGTCSDVYQVTQYNNEALEDGCLTEGVPTFSSLQAFEGFTWTEIPASDGATTSTKVGVRITAAYEDTRFGGCSFNPSDYYNVRPLRLEVTALVNAPGLMQGEISSVCEAPIPSRKTRFGAMSTQSGEWLIRKLIGADRYKVHGEFYHDPRLREVMDSNHLDIVNTNANYVAYFFKYKQFRGNQNHTADFSPEVFEAIIAFPVGTDTSAFETAVQKVSSTAGVVLKNR